VCLLKAGHACEDGAGESAGGDAAFEFGTGELVEVLEIHDGVPDHSILQDEDKAKT